MKVLSPSGEVLNQEEMVHEDRRYSERRREVEKLKIVLRARIGANWM